jgi:hypothetical protein
MFDRLGPLGTLAALVVVGAGLAAYFQKSTIALVFALVAAGYVAMCYFRTADA